MFYLTGDIEKYGTGSNRVREWFAGYHNLDFKIKDLVNFIQVIVYNKDIGKDVTDLQKSILKLIKLKKSNLINRIGSRKDGYCEIK